MFLPKVQIPIEKYWWLRAKWEIPTFQRPHNKNRINYFWMEKFKSRAAIKYWITKSRLRAPRADSMCKGDQRPGRRRARSLLELPSRPVIWIIDLEAWWIHRCTALIWHKLQQIIMVQAMVQDLLNQKNSPVARSQAIMKITYILDRKWLRRTQETLSKRMYHNNKQWVPTQGKMTLTSNKDL